MIFSLLNLTAACYLLARAIRPTAVQAHPNQRPIKLTNNTKVTNWDRERIIFDYDYNNLAIQLKKKLLSDRPLDDYDIDIMPLTSAIHSTAQITVGLHFRLIEVADLDTTNEELSIVYSTQLFWYDPKLVWYRPDLDRNPNLDLPSSFLKLNKNLTDINLKDILITYHDAKRKMLESDNADDLNHILDYLLDPAATAELRHEKLYDYYDYDLSDFHKAELDKFKAVQFIQVKAVDIWTPDILVYNSNAAKHYSHDGNSDDQTDVTIFSDGLVIWEPIIHHTVSCQFTLAHFPYDVQMCHLDIGSWYYTASNLRLILANTTTFMEEYEKNLDTNMPFKTKIDSGYSEGAINAYSLNRAISALDNGEWHFVAAGIRIGKDSFQVKSWARFYLILARNPNIYIINILVTCVLLAATTFLAFFIPAGADRLNLIFAILITMSVYQMITADVTPRSSSESPILAISILGFIVMINFSAVVCMMLIRLDKNRETGKEYMLGIIWTLTKILIKIFGAGQKSLMYQEKILNLVEKLNVSDKIDKPNWTSLRHIRQQILDHRKTVATPENNIENRIKLSNMRKDKALRRLNTTINPTKKNQIVLTKNASMEDIIASDLRDPDIYSEEELAEIIHVLRGDQYDLLSIVINRMFGLVFLGALIAMTLVFFIYGGSIEQQVEAKYALLDEYTYLCTCNNGVPNNDNTCKNLNPKDSHEYCDSCDKGYHLANHRCVANICSCDNGLAATGTLCFDADGGYTELYHKCSICQAGYFKTAEDKCEIKSCVCQHGKGSTYLDCPSVGNEFCSSCQDGYDFEYSSVVEKYNLKKEEIMALLESKKLDPYKAFITNITELDPSTQSLKKVKIDEISQTCQEKVCRCFNGKPNTKTNCVIPASILNNQTYLMDYGLIGYDTDLETEQTVPVYHPFYDENISCESCNLGYHLEKHEIVTSDQE